MILLCGDDRMNKKGFTLIELLTVVVIIALLSGIAAVSYSAIVSNSNRRSFKVYERTMYAEVMTIFVNDPSQIPANNGTKRFELPQLIAAKEIDPFNNPKNPSDSCPDSYVEVTRNDVASVNSLNYKVCLICKNSDYNVDGTDCLLMP